MTTSKKKDIPNKADAKQAGISEKKLSDDSLEGVTGGCNEHDNHDNHKQSVRNSSSFDKWGGPRQR